MDLWLPVLMIAATALRSTRSPGGRPEDNGRREEQSWGGITPRLRAKSSVVAIFVPTMRWLGITHAKTIFPNSDLVVRHFPLGNVIIFAVLRLEKENAVPCR